MQIIDETSAIRRFEQALALAVHEFGSRLRQERASSRSSTAALLCLLQLNDVSADDVLAGRLVHEARTEVLDRANVENRRLVRLARQASLAYDLNRHLAVRRLIDAVEGGSRTEPSARPSGSELNRRFAGRRRRHQALSRLSLQPAPERPRCA